MYCTDCGTKVDDGAKFCSCCGTSITFQEKSEDHDNASSSYKRAELFLESGDWHSASVYFEKVLDSDPENAKAYIGLLLSSRQISCEEQLINETEPFYENKLFQHALRFADSSYKVTLDQYVIDNTYFRVQHTLSHANCAESFRAAKNLIRQLPENMDVNAMLQDCDTKEQQWGVAQAKQLMKTEKRRNIEQAITLFNKYGRNSSAKEIQQCNDLLAAMERKKKAITWSIVAGVFLFLILGSLNNNKKSEEIYNNLLGSSFSCVVKDNNFTSSIIRRQEDTYKITFHSNGRVTESKLHYYYIDSSYTDPYESSNDYSNTEESFTVKSSFLWGTRILVGKTGSYKVDLGLNNKPYAVTQTAHGFYIKKGIRLTQ